MGSLVRLMDVGGRGALSASWMEDSHKVVLLKWVRSGTIDGGGARAAGLVIGAKTLALALDHTSNFSRDGAVVNQSVGISKRMWCVARLLCIDRTTESIF